MTRFDTLPTGVPEGEERPIAQLEVGMEVDVYYIDEIMPAPEGKAVVTKLRGHQVELNGRFTVDRRNPLWRIEPHDARAQQNTQYQTPLEELHRQINEALDRREAEEKLAAEEKANRPIEPQLTEEELINKGLADGTIRLDYKDGAWVLKPGSTTRSKG